MAKYGFIGLFIFLFLALGIAVFQNQEYRKECEARGGNAFYNGKFLECLK